MNLKQQLEMQRRYAAQARVDKQKAAEPLPLHRVEDKPKRRKKAEQAEGDE